MKAGITTTNLTKTYAGSNAAALDDLSISVAPGEVYGYLGANGAGKSTTIRLLLNFIQPSKGSASILGYDIVKDSVNIKQRAGYLSGDIALYPKATGRQLLKYLGDLQGMTDTTYRDELVKRFEATLDQPIGQLSRGNRQKIGVIQACMHQPDVLILDEPTSGLDPLMQEHFYSTIREAKERGAAVLMSSHNFAEVQRTCDRIGILRHGKLVREGDLAEFSEAQKPVMQVVFAKAVPTELAKSKAVKIIESKGRMATIQATGSLAELLGALSRYDISDLHTQQQELEGEFLSYYQEEES